MKKLITFLLLLIVYSAVAQEALKAGFMMLERGQFTEAAVFFRNYLQTDPNNRTALLCYGRAVGLSGDVAAAQSIFAQLEKQYPGDFEIALNAAEALMWGKEYTAARNAYVVLLQQQPASFPANLGYGNALASLLQFDSALVFINKALQLQPGNANALVSRKYTRLALADRYGKQQQYSLATPLLDSNLADFHNDRESLQAKAQLLVLQQQYTAAIKILQDMIQLRLGVVDAQLSLSYIAFRQKHKKLALQWANLAVQEAARDTTQYLKARLGRVIALGWNEKFALAYRALDSLAVLYPGRPDITLRRATLMAWQRNFGRSLSLYRTALTQVPTSFDANLGTADVLFATEMDKASRAMVDSTLRFYPGQKDAQAFLERLALRHAPVVTTHDYYSWDQGGNIAWNYQLGLAADLATPLRISLDYKTRHTEDRNTHTTARNDNYTLGLRWRIKPFWLVKAAVNQAMLIEQQKKSYWLLDASTEFSFLRRHMLELKYRRDVQNFTSGLIGSNLTTTDLAATYNVTTPVNLGLYSQYIFSRYSDNNQRNLLFASVYYTALTDPVLKGGFNINLIRFQDQVPAKYFSPAKFISYECFVTSENLELPNRHWLYQALAAGGEQQIGQEGTQFIYRFNLSLGYRYQNNLELTGYFLHSNSASSTVAGYTYSEAGIRGKWILKRLYDRIRRP